MKSIIADLHTRLRFLGAMVLLVGLGSSVLIYQQAGDYAGHVLGYEMINGVTYPLMSQDSKKYRHDLELIGGKAAVLSDELSHWFVGLWQGKSLAFTVAGIASFIAFVLFFISNHLPPRLPSDDPQQENHA
jgi:hypothetical protein